LQNASKIILGIDPGTLVMGYGLIVVENKELRLVEMNVLKLHSKLDNYQRLQLIHQKVQQIIACFHPHEFAIEAPFFGQNVQSMLKLGRAQGVAIAAAIQAGIPVTEYSPKKVKQSVTGNGNADKEQVWKMLQHILQVESAPTFFDASDAVAVAVCHHFQLGNPIATGGKKPKGWQEFVSRNPERVRAR
jgi:crossover junction endodeoxyribonuclease RuvC